MDAAKRANLVRSLERLDAPDGRMDTWLSGRWDVVLFTASMDCGVSIANVCLHYHKCIVMLNNRSVSAQVVLQMIQRFRRFRDNEVVLYCNPSIRDYQHRPGYTHSQIQEVADELRLAPAPGISPLAEYPTVQNVKAYLDINYTPYTDAEYHVATAGGTFVFHRRKAPGIVPLHVTRDAALMPVKVHHHSDSVGEIRSDWRAFIAEARTTQQASLNVESQGLVSSPGRPPLKGPRGPLKDRPRIPFKGPRGPLKGPRDPLNDPMTTQLPFGLLGDGFPKFGAFPPPHLLEACLREHQASPDL